MGGAHVVAEAGAHFLVVRHELGLLHPASESGQGACVRNVRTRAHARFKCAHVHAPEGGDVHSSAWDAHMLPLYTQVTSLHTCYLSTHM